MKPIILRAHEVRQLNTAGEVLVVRLIKPQPVPFGSVSASPQKKMAAMPWMPVGGVHVDLWRCPLGTPSERRWVREAWRPRISHGCSMDACDCDSVHVTYAADGERSEGRYFTGYQIPDTWLMPKASKRGNVSPVTMPRWASRYVVEIAEVHAKQVQSITEAEAIAAGVRTTFLPLACADGTRVWHVDNYPTVQCSTTSAVDAYGGYFETVHGPGSWDANPWAWLARVRRVEA